MVTIEDIMYEAHHLGITDMVFKKVSELKKKEKHKYTDLNTIYAKAFNKVLKKSIKN
jgi:uncharacterized protein (UPF0335 family)